MTTTAESAPAAGYPLDGAGRMLAEEITRLAGMPHPVPTAQMLGVALHALGVYSHAGGALAANHAEDAAEWECHGDGARLALIELCYAPSISGVQLTVDQQPPCPTEPRRLTLPTPPGITSPPEVRQWVKDLMFALGGTIGYLLERHSEHAEDPADAHACERAAGHINVSGFMWLRVNGQLASLHSELRRLFPPS